MNIPATTQKSNTTMNPPVARNQEKNDAMSAAAAVALTGLQSVSTGNSTSTDGNSNSNKTGKKTRKTGKKDEAVAIEVSKTFPQIVSRHDCRFDVDRPPTEQWVRFFAGSFVKLFTDGPAQALPCQAGISGTVRAGNLSATYAACSKDRYSHITNTH